MGPTDPIVAATQADSFTSLSEYAHPVPALLPGRTLYSRRQFITPFARRDKKGEEPDRKFPGSDLVVPKVGGLKIPRRTTIMAAGAGISAGILVAAEIKHIRDDWRQARLPNERFLSQNPEIAKNLQIGCSFAPEVWPDPNFALERLQFIVEDLGVKRIRFGLRWPNVTTGDGAFTLDRYKPFLDYLLDQEDVSLCLNTGIKVFGWPEIRVPELVFNELPSVPKPDAVIYGGSVLAKQSLKSFDACLDYLASNYSAIQRERITGLMHENEPINPYGEKFQWTMDKSYLMDAYILASTYFDQFPRVKIVANSAGRRNLNPVYDLFISLQEKDPRFRGRQVCGYNYYYTTPSNDKPIVHYFDNTYALLPGRKSCIANIAENNAADIETAATEMQMEPYSYLGGPGDSAVHLRYALLRVGNRVLQLPADPKPRTAYIWGAERFANKMSARRVNPEHKEMAELIKMVTNIG